MTEFIAITCYLFTLIFSYVHTIRYWKLRGRSYEELTQIEKSLVIKALGKVDPWVRNKYTPETYLPRLQSKTVFSLILSILYTFLPAFLFIYIFNNY